MFKVCLHKQPKYKYFQCKKCSKIKNMELFKSGYQPKKYINNGEIKLENKVRIINIDNIPDNVKKKFDYSNVINKIGIVEIIDTISDNNTWYLIKMPYKYLLNQDKNCIHADNCYVPFLRNNFLLV